MYFICSILLFMAMFGFIHLWGKSRKQVYGNPVVMTDDGNILYFIMILLCFISSGIFLVMQITIGQ